MVRHNRINLPVLKDLKIEIGCGKKHQRREDFIGIDNCDFGQEIVWDCNLGLPLPDNSVKLLYSHHTLEHLDDMVFIMEEIWRVLQKDGRAEIIVPWREHPNSWRSPGHKQFNFAPDFWRWWSAKSLQDDRDSHGTKARFKFLQNEIRDNCHNLVVFTPIK